MYCKVWNEEKGETEADGLSYAMTVREAAEEYARGDEDPDYWFGGNTLIVLDEAGVHHSVFVECEIIHEYFSTPMKPV